MLNSNPPWDSIRAFRRWLGLMNGISACMKAQLVSSLSASDTWEHRERMPSGARKQGYWVCLRTMLGSLALGWSQPYQFPRRLSRGTGDVLGSTWVTFPGDGQVQSGQAERPRSVRLPLQHVPFYRPHPTLSSQPLVEAKRCIPFLWRCDKVPGLPRGLHVVEGRAGVCSCPSLTEEEGPSVSWGNRSTRFYTSAFVPVPSTHVPSKLSIYVWRAVEVPEGWL